jgi:hypothetical protein
MNENDNLNKEEVKILSKEKSNVNKVLVLIIVLLLILLGVAGYFLFIKKDDNKTNEPVVTPTPPAIPQETPNEPVEKLTAGMTFKSKDGKNTFKVVSIDEEDNVRATYNNKKYNFWLDVKSYVGDYISMSGDPETGADGQCNGASVVLNLKTKTIEKMGTTDQPYYFVIKGSKGYFFAHSYCLSGYDTTVYDNNWNKLGRIISYATDSEGYVYVHTNGKIAKYSPDGTKVSEVSATVKYTGPGLIYNNTLYYIGEESGGVYFYNNGTNEKFKIAEQSFDFKEGNYPYTGLDIEVFTRLTLVDGKILINYEEEEANFSYDTTTNQLTKLK